MHVTGGEPHTPETLGIAGAGTIATGLAVLASTVTDVVLWARSPASADRARAALARIAAKLPDLGAELSRVSVTLDLDDLRPMTFLVEAISEDREHKAPLLARLGSIAGDGPRAVVSTTTSSLSVNHLAAESGRPDRFVGLHVFNPVPRMELVEVICPEQAAADVRARTHALCDALGKTAVDVPDTPGFVVNRLLFPYLFDAVALMSDAGLAPEAVDRCMTLGAGLPMGPLALLDFVGLDVARAIGASIGLQAPPALDRLIEQGALGRKSGHGFYNYS